jgi:uncharacterized protein (DUF1697 family)
MPKTQTYAALLRGVNVGGRGKLSMPELVALVSSLGHTDVSSYIQSGNLVLSGVEVDPAKIEAAIAARFGLETRVMLRTHGELQKIAAASPFGEGAHVVFLYRAPKKSAVEALDPNRSPGDRFSVAGREIYLSFAHGAGRTKLTLDWFERQLGVAGTQRNWNTLLKLVDLTAPGGG